MLCCTPYIGSNGCLTCRWSTHREAKTTWSVHASTSHRPSNSTPPTCVLYLASFWWVTWQSHEKDTIYVSQPDHNLVPFVEWSPHHLVTSAFLVLALSISMSPPCSSILGSPHKLSFCLRVVVLFSVCLFCFSCSLWSFFAHSMHMFLPLPTCTWC